MKPRMSVAAKMYTMLLPVLAMSLAAGFIAWRSLRLNSTGLIQALEIKEHSTRSLALLLTEGDATKVLLLDPDNAGGGKRKIQAYDANIAILKEIDRLTNSAEIRETLRQMRDLDDNQM